MTINSISTVAFLFFSTCLVLFNTACTNNSDQKSKETIENLASGSVELPKLDSNQIRRVERTFYRSGKLKKIAFFERNQLVGYVKSFDSLGRLVRESRYGWTDEMKNSLVENIVYDSLKNINYTKSFFLSTVPESVNDTIYFLAKETKKIDLKVKFDDPNLLSSRIIVKYDNHSDTLNLRKGEWKTYTFFELKKAVTDIHFSVEVKKSDSLISIHESKRVLKWAISVIL